MTKFAFRHLGRTTDIAVILAAAIVIAAAFNRREGDQVVKLSKEDWEALVSSGSVIGNSGARVTLVEFVDYQCPVCAHLEGVIMPLQESDAVGLRRVIRHYPLTRLHAQAENAAVAFECASQQGSALEMHTALLRDQEAVAVGEWNTLARNAGVQDMHKFQACLESPEPRQRVRDDFKLGNALGVSGTPTFILDRDWLAPASPPQLRERLRKALQ